MENKFPKIPLYYRSVPHIIRPGATVKVGFHSLFDVIKRLLQYPGNFERMKFHAIHQTDFSKEMWHGSIFRESPLYTFPKCSNSCGSYSIGDSVAYEDTSASGETGQRLGRIVAICAVDPGDAKYTELCKRMTIGEALNDLRATKQLMVYIRPYLQSDTDHSSELILDMENSVELLDLEKLKRTVRVGRDPSELDLACDNDPEHSGQSYFCNMARKSDGHGGHMIVTRPLLPIEAFGLNPSALDHPVLPTLRLFILHYFDEFGTYNKVYHKTGGSYISLGNLPHSLQVKLHNQIPILFLPPTADKNACHDIFVEQLKELEAGVVMDLGPVLGKCFVVGGLGATLSDMPEGNHAMGLKSQGVRSY